MVVLESTSYPGTTAELLQPAIEAQGLAGRISTQVHDLNEGLPSGEFDVVIANQSLHHVLDLEHLFAEVWTRPGLSNRDRRLLLIGALAGSGQEDVLDIQLPAALSLA